MSSSKGKGAAPPPPTPITFDPLAAKDGDDSDDSDPEFESKKRTKNAADMAYHPMSQVELDKLDPTLEVLELTHNRLTAIPAVIPKLEKLEVLVMRRNLIKAITGLDALDKLEHLDLQDNLIQSAAGVATLTNLEQLDLSYNAIRRVQNPETNQSLVPVAPKLQELYLNSNKIRATPPGAIPALNALRTLELGDNRIRDIEGIFHLSALNKLFYGKNKIATVPNMAPLTNLTVLSLQSNRITQITGLSGLSHLRELYLSHNGLKSIGDGLVGLNELEILDVAGNFLTTLSEAEVGHLVALEDFWANDNKLSGWEQLDALKPLKNLTTVYLERNPALWKDDEYVEKIRVALPGITQIDAIPVTSSSIRKRLA